MRSNSQKILFLVHPGSACGSADMNLGRYEAAAARDVLILDVSHWNGGLVVIDGELSDELTLPRYAPLGQAIEAALQAARAAGYVSQRIVGDDSSEDQDQSWAAGRAVHLNGLMPDISAIAVTGCWYDYGEESGCVTSVKHALEGMGFKVAVLPGAITEPEPDDDFDGDDMYEADEATKLSWRAG